MTIEIFGWTLRVILDMYAVRKCYYLEIENISVSTIISKEDTGRVVAGAGG